MKVSPIRAIVDWIPVAVCMAVIFAFSAQPAQDSAQTSSGLLDLLRPLLAWWTDRLPPEQQEAFFTFFHMVIRKTAHFTIYFVMALFSWRAWGNYRFSTPLRALFSVGLCSLYAVSDEIHQSFVPGRGPGAGDVVLDTVGALCAVALCLWAGSRKGKKSQ